MLPYFCNACNEKYIGDAIFQKTYGYSQFNRQKNNGEKEQYLIRDHHEPIISREDFEAAQKVIEQRGKEKGVEKYSEKYLSRYPFSGKIICGQCDGKFTIPADANTLPGAAPPILKTSENAL